MKRICVNCENINTGMGYVFCSQEQCFGTILNIYDCPEWCPKERIEKAAATKGVEADPQQLRK